MRTWLDHFGSAITLSDQNGAKLALCVTVYYIKSPSTQKPFNSRKSHGPIDTTKHVKYMYAFIKTLVSQVF